MTFNYPIVLTSLFFLCFIFSLLINYILLRFAQTLGIRNKEEYQARWNNNAKPALGGISFYVIFLFSFIFTLLLPHSDFGFNLQIVGILIAATLAFLMGLADDAFNTQPLLKFLTQVFCAFIIIFSGHSVIIFENQFINYLITIFWVVGIMNSINMLDNMDAITTIVSITVILSALMIVYLSSDGTSINVILLIGVLSALSGFLFFNWHPAKMFMGDTGSQFLGLFLAGMGIIYFWNTPDVHGKLIQSKQFFVTILTFAIPIIDTTTVVINRLSNRKSPFVGGKDHTTHSFFYMGLTEKRIALLYAGICFISMFFNLLIIKYIEHWGYIHIALFSVYFISLFWFLYAPARKHNRK